jgi:hypothetical protein
VTTRAKAQYYYYVMATRGPASHRAHTRNVLEYTMQHSDSY